MSGRQFCRTKPCSECPFGRNNPPNAEDFNPLEIVAQAHGPFLLACHMEPGSQGRETPPAVQLELAQCAGAATFRANVGVAELMPQSLHTLPADTGAVFATPTEFLAHHSGKTLEQAEAFLRLFPPGKLLAAAMDDARNKILLTPKQKEG